MLKLLIRGLFLLFIVVRIYGQSADDINLLIMQENYPEALESLQGRIKTDSSDQQLLYKMGLCYYGLYDFISAARVLEAAAGKDSSNTKVLMLLARTYKNAGNLRKAKDLYINALRRDSLNSITTMNLAAIHVELQEFRDAEKLYRALIKQDSTNSFYYKQTGLCLYKLDDLKNAAECYEKALRWNGSDINSTLDLALIYFRMEKLDSAFMTVNKKYGLFGNDSRMDKMLGEIHMKRKDYVYSEKYFRRAVQYGDTSAAVLQKLGIAIYLVGAFNSPPDSAVIAGTFREAKKYLEWSFTKNNKDALTSLYLGLACKELHEYTKAVKLIEDALNLAVPAYLSDVYNYLASAYESCGEYQKALKTYGEALERNPANKTIYYYMAYIYDKKLSDREAALKYYQQYVDWEKADKLLKAFAETRIDKLREEQFFRTGSSQLK